MLSEVSQRKTNTAWYHLYVEPKKVEARETESTLFSEWKGRKESICNLVNSGRSKQHKSLKCVINARDEG